MHRIACGLLAVLTIVSGPAASAQSTLGTRNVSLAARLPIGGSAGPIWLDQDPARPYLFAARDTDVAIVTLADPARPEILASIKTPSPVSSMTGVVDASGRHLVVLGGAGSIAWVDVSDPTSPKNVGQTDVSDVHALFGYHASDGKRLVFVAAGEEVIRLDASDPAAVGTRIGLPEGARGRARRLNGVYAAYHVDTMSDRLYTAGTGGYAVFDVTSADSSVLVTFVQPGTIELGSGVQATPEGTHIITTAGYRTAPVRIFDLRPAVDGETSAVRTDVGAWTANWRNGAQDFELRWPYLFVAAGPDGFHMVNVRNPFEPYTTASWRTWDGPTDAPGAVSVDVRDHDGLIAVADARTGIWLLRIGDFRGWDGRGWGVPDLDSAQRWDRLPVHSDRW